jgi:hypothetical protein
MLKTAKKHQTKNVTSDNEKEQEFKKQKQNRYCVRQEGSGPAGLPRQVKEV